ncbi:glycosyltransferase family 4 protein [Microvirga sp. 2YAF29]|uniref:glycosyltransferase family 4 protein n=1 Tax=Microvirga sp. 2YAF29 TaxID=3233031 RepID=UPI003F97B70D
MRLLIVTDAWKPQVNGVVRSLEYMAEQAPAFGAEVMFLTPQLFRSVPMPSYPEIRLSMVMPGQMARLIGEREPTHIHIATEGPLGHAARHVCRRKGWGFTTSYHTRFPEYLAARAPIPESWSYGFLRRFHRDAKAVMVSTPSLERELIGRGFRNILRWTRGVDTELFHPRQRQSMGLPRPLFLFVGRVSVEKNIEAFLSLDLPGTKVIVGDGPARAELERQYPEAYFLGTRSGVELAQIYASANVFVFPSLTDTFGIVLLEALASGLPVAAFPVTGPLDVIGSSGCGVLDTDLRKAALAALDIPRDRCRAYAESFTWRESARQFFTNIEAAHAAG